jgi:predicted ABC-type ATPase
MITPSIQPTMWIIGGPNGSGKSTLITDLEFRSDFPSCYINADELKIEHKISDYEAIEMADRLRNEAIEKEISFAFETVMSHHNKIDFISYAKESGYFIKLFFVLTETPDINLLRVTHRHL